MIGNILVGQSGGPTAVINSSLAGVFKTAKELSAGKVYGMLNGIEGFLDGRFVDLSEHITSDLDIEVLKRTPSSYLGSCRFKLPSPEQNEEIYVKLFDRLKNLGISHFFYIGGNDSMDTIKMLSNYAKSKNYNDITFMGIPKTIDNDLAITDHTPGFGSAAKYIATSMKEITSDGLVYHMDSVTIVEIMGRNTGWLTAAAALSRSEDCDGPDLIYLPESRFELNSFLNRVKDVKQQKKAMVIAVSEGLKDENGVNICELEREIMVKDSFGHKILSGNALFLAEFISREMGIKARGIVLNTLQRCASHIASGTDIAEAYIAGAQAVKAALNGETGKMIIFERTSNDPYHILTSTYDINLIANIEKTVPPEWISKDGSQVSSELINYIRPLILGELPPIMIDGLPRHLKLNV